jgi:hypothetical protein
MKPGEWVRVASLVSLIELSLITSYLRKPHFVAFGLIFVQDAQAMAVAGALMVSFLSVSILLLKRKRGVYAFARTLSLLMSVNSLLGIASALVLDDVRLFLMGLGDGAFIGFIFTECLVLFCSAFLYWNLGQSKKALE